MSLPQFPAISADLVRELDAQLSPRGLVAHVSTEHGPLPVLVGVGWGLAEPVLLQHSPLETFLEAELLAQRLNLLQSVSDSQRLLIVQSMRRTQ